MTRLQRNAKKLYELAKHVLGKPKVEPRVWLLVVGALGWKKEMVDDPKGNRFEYVARVTAPNGNSILIYPSLPSQEHQAEVDAWMRRETLEQLQREVQTYEAAQQEASSAQPRHTKTRDLGVPISKADFSGQGDLVYQIDFGLVDEKGRAVGFQASIYRDEQKPEDEAWQVFVRPSRNGKWFGASHGSKGFKTRPLAEAYARKAMMASFKRYSRMYSARPS